MQRTSPSFPEANIGLDGRTLRGQLAQLVSVPFRIRRSPSSSFSIRLDPDQRRYGQSTHRCDYAQFLNRIIRAPDDCGNFEDEDRCAENEDDHDSGVRRSVAIAFPAIISRVIVPR